ncbi:MAG TPA: mechanosensitive ion channel domain-containing protein [Luteibaculaceae bacterium]|jgi:miniconductance mechanosensitive channel|nr:mechanosensitive ion channel domain-containing protein [Luteibaculaceae bacterium]
MRQIDAIKAWLLEQFAISGVAAEWIRLIICLAAMSVLWFVLVFAARRILVAIFTRVAAKTTTTWDDILLKNKVFLRLAHILPAFLMEAGADTVLSDFPKALARVNILITLYLIGVFVSLANSLLNSLREALYDNEHLRDKPINSYIQVGKIIIYFIGGIMMISEVLGKNPLYLLGAMGAASAVLLLVFKDTILGLVASIQLSANDILRVGDWVTMDKYGADGDVMEINLATIKVQNFDLTITTIPTYAFISDSFKNWRGMQESPGRRIKRAIKINKSSIKFCTNEMLEKYKQIDLIRPYIEQKLAELSAHNEQHVVNKELPINGRSLTNIGVFRKYLEFYLKNNPKLNPAMDIMVRHLPPSESGLPIEIYAFTYEKKWANYENVMADIFDHVLAAVAYFDLSTFQNPTGADFQGLVATK